MAIALVAATSAVNAETPVIGKHQLTISNGLMTPEVLWSFGRVAGVQVSPNGLKVLYSVSYYSVAENKGNSELFVMNIDGSDKKQITKTATREAAAKWMKDGEHIAFLSSETAMDMLAEKILFADIHPGEIVVVDVAPEGSELPFSFNGVPKAQMPDVPAELTN